MSSMPCESVLLHLCTPPPRDPICTLTPPVPAIGFPGLLHILDHQPCEACDACIPRICIRYGGGDGVHPEHKRGGARGGGGVVFQCGVLELGLPAAAVVKG